jgi:hypothetical protein
LINFISSSAGCFLLKDEGFSCSLDVFYGGWDKLIAIFDQKQIKIISVSDPDPGSGMRDG